MHRDINDPRIDITPFDRAKVPPRQNLFLLPLMWLICKFVTMPYKLKIDRYNMEGYNRRRI